MNPPSALYGAMNKERKPFTYTPGGLDLSQIKSERMAQRLMRNAMDQGVPEQPTPHLQSPPTPTALNVPNFNCLPVQVFPTFPLPSNPKSLLKTRNNQQKELCLQDIPNSEQLKTDFNQIGLKQCFENNNQNISNYNQPNNDNKNNEQSPLYEYTPPIVRPYPCYETSDYVETSSPKCYIPTAKELITNEDNQFKYYDDSVNNRSRIAYEPSVTTSSDTPQKPLLTSIYTMEKNIPETLEEVIGTENNQSETKVVKKQVETENNTEGQNGDANVEAAVTIKLPGKKSSAKTETKVEVVKNVRPDGSTEEVKTTTTKTTIDGKTEIKTKTETTIIPKEEEYEEEELVGEEEEEEEEEQETAVVEETVATNENQKENNVENSEVDEDTKQEQKENLSTQEETSETIVTKQVTVTQSEQNQENSEEEVEEVEEEEEEKEVEVESKNEESQIDNKITDNREESEEDADDEDEQTDIQNEKIPEPEEDSVQENQEPETKQEEKVEESETVDTTESEVIETRLGETNKTEDETEKDVIIDDSKSTTNVEKEVAVSQLRDNEQSENSTAQTQDTQSTHENKEEIIIEVQVLKPSSQEPEDSKMENEIKSSLPVERNIPFREPSAPLEKVEDVEIKPIGEIISKTRTENTEIITTSLDKPTTGLSTQTAYNRIENIVTVNKTTKTLDHAYDQHAPLGIPTVKTYFAPTDRLSTSPYQPVYAPEPQTERRHSLLLERLSVDRQMPPAELYQTNYQTYEQNQWTQEPQSEVLTVSNVKPSTITKNQQWYQQTRKEEVSYDTPPTINAPTQDWSTPTQQRQTPQPSQTQFQYQPQTQSSYIDKQDTFTSTLNNSSTYQQSTYQPSYTPKPSSWVGNNANLPKTVPTINKPPSQYSYVNKEPTETYQAPPQPYSSSYIPPPWEQDSNYVPESLNTSYYTPPPSNTFTSNATPAWTPKPTSKFTKPKPTSYIPPAPNQSFVKPVTAADQPKLPGRKTYYSEYERRYISVPESTYIPTENKFQAQPDPSPQYYYDNNEPKETVEHEWRKELREFSEKTQSQTNTEEISVRPPWEEDPKYYVPTVTTEYTPTPTWSQTLRPNSWRDRSFESEFGRAKELSRTNTLGRGRPQSSYGKSNISTPISERTRGVSVDRYNPNNYKSPVPSEYPPVQSHTLDPSVGAKTYHNSNVPAYHSRASAEPREQSAAFPQPRHYAEARAPPLQSRSFKYLQWITGTED